MLITEEIKYIKTPFRNEDEPEQEVISNFESLFGSTLIYLLEKFIKTCCNQQLAWIEDNCRPAKILNIKIT
jgi:hypothetical protein